MHDGFPISSHSDHISLGKVYNIHAADESIGCDELLMITKIYARAMYILAK